MPAEQQVEHGIVLVGQLLADEVEQFVTGRLAGLDVLADTPEGTAILDGLLGLAGGAVPRGDRRRERGESCLTSYLVILRKTFNGQASRRRFRRSN